MSRHFWSPLLLSAVSIVVGSAGEVHAEEANDGGGVEVVDEAGDGQDQALETPRPTEWRTSKGRQCRRHRRRRICDGPRMVPVPHGKAAELAEALGLGSRRTASELLLGPPRAEWVEAVEAEAPEKLLWPVCGGKLWRGFGRVRHRGRRRFHRGVDIGAPEGTLVRSVADGLVAYSDNGSRGYGNLLMVVHADGSVAFYAHNKANYVFAGQRVKAGQVISEVGKTGITSGAHLHFELRIKGAAVDPLPRFEDAPARRKGAVKRRRRAR